MFNGREVGLVGAMVWDSHWLDHNVAVRQLPRGVVAP